MNVDSTYTFTNIERTKNRMIVAEATLVTLDTRVTALETSSSSLQAQINVLDGRLDVAEPKITTLEGKVATLEAAVNTGALYSSTWDASEVDLSGVALTWTDLNLSALVPTGTILVYLRIVILDDVIGSWVQFANKDHQGDAATLPRISTQAVAVTNEAIIIVPCNAARLISWRSDIINTAWTSVLVKILGWWK